jgi:hypothetical protein
VIVTIWLIGTALAWLPFAVVIGKHVMSDCWEDYLFGSFMGLILAFAWPLLLPVVGGAWVVKRWAA